MVNKQLQKLAGESQKVEEAISRQLSDQTTLQKCSQATQDGAERIRRQIHEKVRSVVGVVGWSWDERSSHHHTVDRRSSCSVFVCVCRRWR